MLPTALLGALLIYWLVAIVGALDLEFLDFDLDMDGGDGSGPFYAIAAFLNVGGVPFALILSIWILSFWIISMMLYYLPIEPGGLINGVLLIPAFAGAMYVTGLVTRPMQKFFKNNPMKHTIQTRVMDKRCTLLCDVTGTRLGQARIRQQGAEMVINVKAEFPKDVFTKGEIAFVFRKDEDKDIYYITKPIFNSDSLNNGGE